MRRLVALAAVLPALAVPAGAGAVTLQGAGSSAEQPILNVLFRAYSKLHKGIRFAYNPDGGNAGVKLVQSGQAEFAVNTRPPLPSDSGTTYTKIFRLDTNWSQVGGSNLSTTIDPVGRNSTAGSYTFFQQAVLNGKTQSSNVLPETSDGLVATTVKQDPNSIGYVGLAHSGSGSGVKTLSLNGVACTQANIKSKTYPLWRFIWAVLPTPGSGVKPDPRVEAFFNWVATNHKAGSIIRRAGAVPAFNK